MSYRILHLIDSLDLGGAQVVLLNLLRSADRTRFTHEAACLHGRGVFWPLVAATGVPLTTLSFHHYFPSYLPLLFLRLLSRRYDIVHCHLLAANVIGKPLAALCRIPVRINHDHCNDKLADSRLWAFPADTWSNRFASHVIAVSESTRAFVEHQEHVPASRTSTIHNGIDCEIYRPQPELRAEARQRWQLPADAFVVAGIGRLTYQKNFSLFLQIAAETLRLHPHAFFVIAGTGEEEPVLRDLAHALGVAERVRFLGYVPAISELYPALDLLLLNSRFEGLPITILEAMATGIPIVASNLDGIAEVLTDGHDASLVPSGNAAPFSAAIARMIENPELVRTYTERALEKVRAHYSAERMTREVESVYLRCLGQAAPRG